MAWFKLDELAEFGENNVAKRQTTNSKSNSKSEVLVNFVQGSVVSTFATKKTKAKSPNNVEGSNDISTLLKQYKVHMRLGWQKLKLKQISLRQI